MTSKGLGELFEADSVDTSAGKFPLVSMGGQAEGLACADLRARNPIGASGNLVSLWHIVRQARNQSSVFINFLNLVSGRCNG